MKKTAINPNYKSSATRSGYGSNKKWPAQDEQTMYNKLTIGQKENSQKRNKS